MLYDKLIDIYHKNNFLRENYGFDESYKRLREYIFEEVNMGNVFLSPFRFSKMFNLDLEDTIRFFLAISSPCKEDDFIQIVYKYSCEECGEVNYFSSGEVVSDDLACSNCGEEVFGSSMDTDRFVLLFEMANSMIDEFKSLKVHPLSKHDADIGRGITIDMASTIIKENPEINPPLKVDLQAYWDIANAQE